MADMRARIEVDNRQALQAISQVQTGVTNLGNRFGALQSVVAGVGFGALIQQANQFAQVVQNVSGATGISTTTVQQFANAVRAVGGDAQGTSRDLIEFIGNLDDARRGGADAQKSLAEVGISVQDLQSLGNQELFTKAFKNIQGIEDAMMRNKKAAEMFGEEFKKIDIRRVNLGAQPSANQGAIAAAANAQQNLGTQFANLQTAIVNSLKPINEAFSKINIAVADWERNISIAFQGVINIIAGFIALKLGSKLSNSFSDATQKINDSFAEYQSKLSKSYNEYEKANAKFEEVSNLRKQAGRAFNKGMPISILDLDKIDEEYKKFQKVTEEHSDSFTKLKNNQKAFEKETNKIFGSGGIFDPVKQKIKDTGNSIDEFSQNLGRGGKTALFSIGSMISMFGKFTGVIGIILGVVAALDLLFAALGRRGPTKVFMDGMADIGRSADDARQRIEKLRQEQERYREQTAGTLDAPATQATPITPMGRAARLKQDREDALRNAEAIKQEMLATAQAMADAVDMKKIVNAEELARFDFRKPFLDALGAAERLNLEIDETQALQARLATADSITVAVEQRRLQLTQQRNAVLADIDTKVKDIESRIAQGFIIDEVDLKRANRELADLKAMAETVRAVFGSIIRESVPATREALTQQQNATVLRDTKLFGSELRRNIATTREGFELQNAQRMMVAKMIPLSEEERRIRQAVLDVDMQREGELQRIRMEVRRLNEEEAAGVDDPGRANRIKELLASQEAIKQTYDQQRVAVRGIVEEEIKAELVVRQREESLQNSIDLIQRQYEQYRNISDIVNKTTKDVREQIAEEKKRGVRMRPDPRLTIDIEGLEIAERNTRDMRKGIEDLYDTIEDEAGDLPLAETVTAQVSSLRNGVTDIVSSYMELNRVQQENLAYSRTWEAGWKQAFDAYTEGVRYAANISRDVFNSTFSAIEGALDILTSRGRAKFKEFGKAIVKDVMSDLLRISFRRMILAMGFGGFGGGAMANPASMFAGPNGIPFAGAYADGGYIPPGKFGLVGEEGPELMTGPGQITPLDKLGGGGGPQVVNNININAIDTRSVAEFFAQNKMLLLGTVRGAEKSLPQRSRF